MKWNRDREYSLILRSTGPQINIYIYYHYFVQTCSWPFRFVSFGNVLERLGLSKSGFCEMALESAGERYIKSRLAAEHSCLVEDLVPDLGSVIIQTETSNKDGHGFGQNLIESAKSRRDRRSTPI